MKIGIVTITELDNFGNRLQNFALQHVLQELGHTVETIPNYITYKKRKSKIYKVCMTILGRAEWILKGRRQILSNIAKQKRFEKFDKKYFTFSKKYSTINYISEDLDLDYDAFVAGSDQIWNSNFTFNFEFNFLRFTKKEKRIVYAASFGSDFVKESCKDKFTQYISDIEWISVREKAGAKIVKQMIGKTVPVLPDPTLLIDIEYWKTIEKRPDWFVDDKYILTYYLGNTTGRKSIFNQLFAKNESYCEYKVLDIHDPNIPDQYATTPDEFLWLVHHAELMVTDSFHGTVFSIMYGTPLCSATRVDSEVSMQSRLESLFNLLGIKQDDLIIDVKGQTEASNKIRQNRIAGLNYLYSALKNIDDKNVG